MCDNKDYIMAPDNMFPEVTAYIQYMVVEKTIT